jgi:hypothetical protein
MTSITSSSSGVPSGVGVQVASGVVIVVMPDAVLKFMYVTFSVGVGVGVLVGSGVFVGVEVGVDVASGVLVGHSSGVALTRLGVAVKAAKETNNATTSPASPIFLRSKSNSPCLTIRWFDCMSVLVSAPATAAAVPARDALGRDRNRDARGPGSPSRLCSSSLPGVWPLGSGRARRHAMNPPFGGLPTPNNARSNGKVNGLMEVFGMKLRNLTSR